MEITIRLTEKKLQQIATAFRAWASSKQGHRVLVAVAEAAAESTQPQRRRPRRRARSRAGKKA